MSKQAGRRETWPQQWPRWGGIRFRKALESKGLLGPEQAQHMVFHASELLQACRDVHTTMLAMKRRVQAYEENPEALADACGVMNAELGHLRYHVGHLRRRVAQLMDGALAGVDERKRSPRRKKRRDEFAARDRHGPQKTSR